MKKLTSFVLAMANPLNIWALDEDLQQTPQVSTVQENIDPAPVKDSALLTAHSVPRGVWHKEMTATIHSAKLGE